jgi:predicted DNA-binding transcriptional regulator AlpA
MRAVAEHGTPLVDDPARLEGVAALGVDETGTADAPGTPSTGSAGCCAEATTTTPTVATPCAGGSTPHPGRSAAHVVGQQPPDRVASSGAEVVPQAEAPLLTDRDVARRLSVSVATVQRLRASGRGPRALRVGARAVRYRPEDLDVGLRSRGAP